MNESVEVVTSDAPFIVRRTVRWADCDPAGAVYTGRFTEYLLGAVRHFLRSVRGGVAIASDLADVDLPCKHMSLTFNVMLVPDDVVDIRVDVGEIRTHTFDIVARARLSDGRLAFEGRFVPICVRPGVRERTPIPPSLRSALQQHLISKEGSA